MRFSVIAGFTDTPYVLVLYPARIRNLRKRGVEKTKSVCTLGVI